MPSERPTTVRLQRLARAYRESGTLLAAVQLDLFSKISQGANTEEKLSIALGISALNAERITIACLGLGLIIRDNNNLKNAPDVERFLIKGRATYAGEWMFFTQPDWSKWGHLADFLTNKEPAKLDNATVKGITVDEARRYHRATFSIGRGAGRLFIRSIDLSNRHKLLDVGGGSGAYCIEACKAYPQLKATILDLPEVTPVAREFIEDNNLSERVDTYDADFNKDSFPEGADIAIMASNLPMYGREAIQAVIQKIYKVLLPDSEFHLIGEALNEDRSGPSDPAIWGLAQTLHNSTGMAHSVAECTGYLKNAGFQNIEVSDFVPEVLTRISGRKAQ